MSVEAVVATGFFLQHGRFAGTFDERAYVPDSTVSLRLRAVSDSAIVIDGTWLEMPGMTCTQEATPSTRGVRALLCPR
jgi:hypothetical protein